MCRQREIERRQWKETVEVREGNRERGRREIVEVREGNRERVKEGNSGNERGK